MNRITSIVAGLSLAFVGTSATIADTIYVPANGSIAAAIDIAVTGDVINLAAGTFNEVNLNPGGKAITIQGTLNTNGSLATTIDGQQGGSVFLMYSSEGSETKIKDLVITGGIGSTFFGSPGGGGIYLDTSSPTISGCVITGNTATYGGGILAYNGSSPTITDCSILDNTGSSIGGLGIGIMCYIECKPNITDCTISGNVNGNGGGGIYLESSDANIRGCTISMNETNTGSGIYIFSSNVTITDCSITDHYAENIGGGIACGNGSLSISDCVILGNTAGSDGGAIWSNADMDITISDSIICGNAPNQVAGEIEGPYTASQSCIEFSCDTCTLDSDDDGVLDYLDQCAGYDDTVDADSDGTPDFCDGCPNDPLKTEPGICGCDIPETTVIGDLDCDGDYDIDDIYAGMANFNITTGTPGDVNADGTVDTSDLDELRTSLDLCASDTDMDGDTDIEDLLNVVAGWGTTCP